MKKVTLLLFIFVVGISCTYAQKKKTLTSYDEVVTEVKKQLNESIKNGAIAEYVTEQNLKGEYIYNITIGDKGKVVTVFAVTSDDDEYKDQNNFKDFLKTIKFEIRTAKGKLYKFEYTFYFE
jgi:hypothetical protein